MQPHIHKPDRFIDLCKYVILQKGRFRRPRSPCHCLRCRRAKLLLPYYKRAFKLKEIDCNERWTKRWNELFVSMIINFPINFFTFLFLPHFDVFCDLLLSRRTATWNLFVKYIYMHVCIIWVKWNKNVTNYNGRLTGNFDWLQAVLDLGLFLIWFVKFVFNAERSWFSNQRLCPATNYCRHLWHWSPLYSNRGKCNLSALKRKNALMLSLG